MRDLVEQLLKFANVETELKKFYSFKKVIDIDKVNIENILASNEFAYDKNKETDAKYFIGYKTGKKIRPLFITFS